MSEEPGRQYSNEDEDVVFVEPQVEVIEVSDDEETEFQSSQANNSDPNQRKDSADEEEDPKCSICLMSLFEGEASVTFCGHVFHKDCILTSLQYSKSCPMCKTRLRRRNPIRRVFLE